MRNNNLFLENGSKIAIIGGGPAGSFFAHFASRYAAEMGIDVSIKIFDRKSFCQRGPRGCNMCAGVISENLFNKLEEEGINIAQYCVQRKIERYCFQTQDEGVLLHHPVSGHTPKIVTVFRGNGPVQSSHEGNVSFDDFLLNHVKKQGVEVIFEIVKEFKLPSKKGQPVKVVFGEGDSRKEFEADLVVGAFGVNTGMMEKVGQMDFGYKPPKTVRTCQCEIMLSPEYIEKTFGNNVFVFALGKKELKFASITPKADYVTVNLVGRRDLTRNNLIDFLNHQSVRKLMPKDWEIPQSFCMCISKIPVTYAKHPCTDRIVVLGDASISRSYKSGIESAFNMAKLSAYTAFKHGVSEKAFMNGYFKPAKRLLARDNFYGIMMLKINDYISSQKQMVNANIKIIRSDKDKEIPNQINEILWNMLTGNAPYRETFYKAMNPRLVLKMLPIDTIAWVRQKRDDINAWLKAN
ncbi:MAG: NAD(P)/FAD-dependent oxidoreductase [Planctomycetota bacterium]|jgi:flavin-dependent dehydrogenase